MFLFCTPIWDVGSMMAGTMSTLFSVFHTGPSTMHAFTRNAQKTF